MNNSILKPLQFQKKWIRCNDSDVFKQQLTEGTRCHIFYLIFDMSLLGFLSLTAGIAIGAYLSSRKTLSSVFLPFGLFFYHLGFSLYYYYYSQTTSSDAVGYYKARAYTQTFKPGADFIEWIVFRLDVFFKANYLDYALLFQLFGFLGFVLLFRIILELLPPETFQRSKRWILILLFLPNLHFWTSSLGKDSLIFLGIMLSIWGLLQFRKRIPALILGLLIIYFVRPHVAGFFLAAVSLALLWGTGIPLRWRVLGTLLTTVILIVLMPKITEFIGLETLSTKSMGDYLYKRQGLNLEGGSSVDIRGYTVPLKFFTFLFRPLFFDAKGLLWLVVSVENLIFILITIFTFSGRLWPLLWRYRVSFFMRFNLFFFLIGVFFFALSISNMGIAIRQKTMLMPSFLILAISVYALKVHHSEAKAETEVSMVTGSHTRRDHPSSTP